ncbi:MAG: WecB/TagA/CpsF family glycosyltransferase [Pontibacterium sp.]
MINKKPVHQQAVLNGVRYHVVDRKGVFDSICWAAEHGDGGKVMNVNIHAMNLAYSDPELRSILNQTDLVFVDGAGVKLGCKIAGLAVGQRLTPADWLDELFEICSEKQWPVFLLGDTDEMGENFEQAMAARYPDCPFAGRHHGFFDRQGEENEQVVEQINHSGAKIILVGMSMPVQEKWIWENRHKLQAPVALATGAFHRIFTGDIDRAPQWITSNGFEWLYRLAMQPHTWRRYILGNPLFILRVFWHHVLGFRYRDKR